jgi:hypothetical protein
MLKIGLSILIMLALPVMAHATPPVTQAQQYAPTPAPVAVPAPGVLGTPITNAMANKFYNGCIGNNTAMAQLNPGQKDMMCACLSAGMQANLMVEDVTNMNNLKTSKGRNAMEKMLTTVYLPCAMIPIKDGIRAECTRRTAANPRYASVGAQYCGCLTDRMINYVEMMGIPEVMYTLQTTGQLNEPFDVLTNGPGYNKALVDSYMKCFNGQMP